LEEKESDMWGHIDTFPKPKYKRNFESYTSIFVE